MPCCKRVFKLALLSAMNPNVFSRVYIMLYEFIHMDSLVLVTLLSKAVLLLKSLTHSCKTNKLQSGAWNIEI